MFSNVFGNFKFPETTISGKYLEIPAFGTEHFPNFGEK
jgi:hypothetical protein